MMHINPDVVPDHLRKRGRAFFALFCTVFVERAIDINKYAKINFEYQLFTSRLLSDNRFIIRQILLPTSVTLIINSCV